jgi:hypothetical protein
LGLELISFLLIF